MWGTLPWAMVGGTLSHVVENHAMAWSLRLIMRTCHYPTLPWITIGTQYLPSPTEAREVGIDSFRNHEEEHNGCNYPIQSLDISCVQNALIKQGSIENVSYIEYGDIELHVIYIFVHTPNHFQLLVESSTSSLCISKLRILPWII